MRCNLSNKNKNILRKTASNNKQPHNSLHSSNLLNLTQRFSTNFPIPNSLPSLQRKFNNIPIYLLYKDQKFAIKVKKDTTYKHIVTMFYKEIIKY